MGTRLYIQTSKRSIYARVLAIFILARVLLSLPGGEPQKGLDLPPAFSLDPTLPIFFMTSESKDNAEQEFINVSVRLKLSTEAFAKINALRDHFGVRTRKEVVQRLLEEILQD